MGNGQAVKPAWGSGSGLKVGILAAVLVAVFALSFLLSNIDWNPGPGPEPGNGGILDTQEAREWVSDCEQKNPSIKEKCPDLFFYYYALENKDEGVCRSINNEEIGRSCRVYFKTI